MSQLNKSIIEPTDLNIYGINSFINKFEDSKEDIINLQDLKYNFKVDFTFDEEVNQIEESPLPAFTQLTFNERIVSDTTSYSSSYNRPPLGPIEKYCYCSYCSNIAPLYHSIECSFPEKKSLFLTMEGLFYYVIQKANPEFSEKLNKLREAWFSNTITQRLLNEFLLIPNSVKIQTNQISSEIPLSNKLTTIQYFDVIILRGPTKLEYTPATQKISNAVMLSYEYTTDKISNMDEDISKKTSIRIYKNGLINLINVPKLQVKRDTLYNSLINRINMSSDAVNIENFNKEASEYTSENFDEYSIVKNASYIHSVNSQFSMWKTKDKYLINMNKLNDIISSFDSFGKIVSGRYTTISTLPKTNKQVIKLDYQTKNKKGSVYIINWEN